MVSFRFNSSRSSRSRKSPSTELQRGGPQGSASRLRSDRYVWCDKPFVNLIHDDVRDTLEVGVAACAQPTEQDACRAKQELAVWASPALAPDGVADAALGLVDVLKPLLCHSSSDSERRDSSRLRHHDRGRAASTSSDLVV
jgi:hypothetical protein